MKAKTPQSNELASKVVFTGSDVLRATVDGTDFVFVPGTEYENLPASDYLFSLWKQGFFKEIAVEKKGRKALEEKSNSNPL